MLTIQQALRQGSELLDDRATAEMLLAHALRQERVYLYAHPEDPLTEVAWIHYGRYLHERLKGKPAQYILKRQEFYGRDFHVTPDVLIPRPETEHLVEAALQRIHPGSKVLDIGTGSGAIAVTLALETPATILASDLSAAALAVARRNASDLGAPVAFLQADLANCLPESCLDVLVSNPPYIALADAPNLQPEVRDWEPHLALFAGDSGLDLYRRLIEDASRVLRSNGWLLLELGYNSLEPVRSLLAGWRDMEITPDLAGIPRVMAARR